MKSVTTPYLDPIVSIELDKPAQALAEALIASEGSLEISELGFDDAEHVRSCLKRMTSLDGSGPLPDTLIQDALTAPDPDLCLTHLDRLSSRLLVPSLMYAAQTSP